MEFNGINAICTTAIAQVDCMIIISLEVELLWTNAIQKYVFEKIPIKSAQLYF